MSYICGQYGVCLCSYSQTGSQVKGIGRVRKTNTADDLVNSVKRIIVTEAGTVREAEMERGWLTILYLDGKN